MIRSTSAASTTMTPTPRHEATLPAGMPNLFLVGCQKCATTWIHRVLREHPQVFAPREDELHYFDIRYADGPAWYERFYAHYRGERYAADTTSSYFRDPAVPARLAQHQPEAHILVCVRNPIDRAFSHYWHEKKKNKIAFEFEELFTNYDLFESWVASGFYARHLARYREHFADEQIMVLLQEDLNRDSRAFVRSIFEFLGVDADFVPSVVDQPINRATYRPTQGQIARAYLVDQLAEPVRWVLPKAVRAKLRQRYRGGRYLNEVTSEYERGMKPQVRDRLREVFAPENERLAGMINRDLGHWT